MAPGVIDADFEGEIKVMTHFPNGVSVVKADQRLEQLIFLLDGQTNNQSKKEKRGKGGFGSSDAYWVQAIGAQRPELTLVINGKRFFWPSRYWCRYFSYNRQSMVAQNRDYYIATRNWSD